MKPTAVFLVFIIPSSYALSLPSLFPRSGLEPRQTAALYVATTGSDSNAGTVAAPVKSIQKAVDLATPGTTIYIRGGTYSPTTNIKIAKNGTSTSRYTIRNYETEKVIIDGEALTGTPAAVGAALANGDRGVFHIQPANYWTFIGLEIINGPYGVYSRDSSNNIYQDLITRDNYESGVSYFS